MIKITRIQTRPDTNVNFFIPRQEKVNYTFSTFVNLGKLSISNSLSDDELIRTSVWIWADQDSLNQYNSNELVQLVKQEESEYITSNGFSLIETIENI